LRQNPRASENLSIPLPARQLRQRLKVVHPDMGDCLFEPLLLLFLAGHGVVSLFVPTS